MVRNKNWQSRIEMATQRRTISKQKKTKMDQKRQWKSSIQEFQIMIDRMIQHHHHHHTKLLLLPTITTTTSTTPSTTTATTATAATATTTMSSCNDDEGTSSSSSSSSSSLPESSGGVGKKIWKLHIWTDTAPLSSSSSSSSRIVSLLGPSIDDDDDEEEDNSDEDEEDDDDNGMDDNENNDIEDAATLSSVSTQNSKSFKSRMKGINNCTATSRHNSSDIIMDDLRKRMRSKSLGEENDHLHSSSSNNSNNNNNDDTNDKEDEGRHNNTKSSSLHLNRMMNSSLSSTTTNPSVTVKGRIRSNSTTTTTTTATSSSSSYSHHGHRGKKKKIHPRSSNHNHNNNYNYNNNDCTNDISSGILPSIYTCRSYFYTGSCDFHHHPTTMSSTTGTSSLIVIDDSPRGSFGRKGNGGGSSMSSSHMGIGNIMIGGSNSGGGRSCRHLHGCCSTNGIIHRNTCLYHIVSRSTTHSDDKKHSKSAIAAHIRKELQRSNDAEQEYCNQFGSSSSSSKSESFQFRDIGAMDMLYHIEIDVEIPARCHSETRSKLPSELISEMMTKLHLYLASITYIAIDTVLVYDRYRNGLLFNTEHELIIALTHSNNTHTTDTTPHSDRRRRQRGNSMGESNNNNDDDNNNNPSTRLTIDPMSWNHIPDTILVHIVSFLPDSTVVAMSHVCQQWYHEIQTNTIIWKNMLDHHDWSHSPTSESYNIFSRISSRHQSDRDLFCQHYSVLRDMKALRNGFDALLDTRNGITSSKEMTYRKFATTTKKHHSPTQPTNCICVRNWSRNRTLVAYDKDCTVRLLETQAIGESGNTACKEIICQKFDPYRTTKKRTCVLQSIDLDEQYIAGIGRVTGADTVAYVLLVMSRDDYLAGDTKATTTGSGGYSEDISNITVIDIGEAIFHYLVSLDEEIFGSLINVVEFLNNGGSIGDVTIIPSSNIAACGNGRFIIDLELYIPNEHDEYDWDQDNENGHLIDKRLYLFSATAGAIVWSYEDDPYEAPQSGKKMVSCFRRQILDGYSKPICYFAALEHQRNVVYSRDNFGFRETIVNQILIGDIEPSGSVHSILHLTLEYCDLSSWHHWIVTDSLMVLSSTDIVIATSLRKVIDRGTSERQVVVSFYDRSQCTDTYAEMHQRSRAIDLVISGDFIVSRLYHLRDDYIAMVCRAGNESTTGPTMFLVTFLLVVIHIPSRKEICRIPLCPVEYPLLERNVLESAHSIGPMLTYDCQDTVALSYGWHGVVMTGRDVREVIEESSNNAISLHKQKKKPHLRNNQGYKKDGFRLGKK